MPDTKGIQTSNTDYAYYNGLPGTTPGAAVAGQIPDSQVVSSGPQVVTTNPFVLPVASSFQNASRFDNPTERSGTYQSQQDQEPGGANVGPQSPGNPDAVYFGDTDKPQVTENRGDVETDLRGEGLGDTGAGVRRGTIQNPSQ